MVRVSSASQPVPQAEVRVGTLTALTDGEGRALLQIPAGSSELTVGRFGFETAKVRVKVVASERKEIDVELEAESVMTEDIVVTATRNDRRVQDLPLRVEVVPLEEINEKLSMTPGDISMMLTETNGLRVQVTSPSLGAASVRVQGLRGRYTQVLSDGLPLYGQSGSISLLQIPPMDLGQVEVIKGVASALFGPSALGGVVNLVSKRPQDGRAEREILLNQTSLGGTDAILWLSAKPGKHWGYTFLGGGHRQARADVDDDGWTDLPSYTRGLVRPRLVWENGTGRSLFVTMGGLAETRQGGTMPGAVAPDGAPFREEVSTRRLDAGLVGKAVLGSTRVLTLRASGLRQWHRHVFGDAGERDVHHTSFAEASMTGAGGPHTWVVGAAIQRDGYRGEERPVFNYAYTVPGVFAQDDYAPVPWMTVSASGRVDHHSEFGTFLSPRVSALLKLGGGWTLRPSAGSGFFAPTPFTEETEASGLDRLVPLGTLNAEQGRSFSADLGWRRGPLELTTTFFRSRIEDPVRVRAVDLPAGRMEIVNAPGPDRAAGSEIIARVHRGEMDLIATHMYVWATEQEPGSVERQEVGLNPRHSASLDWLWDIEGRGRIGLELFYTGRQRLDDSPFRRRSVPYLLWGAVGEWRVGRARLFLNSENLSDVRQTRYDRLVRPTRNFDGRWTVDGWGPLEGRTFNGGLRFSF
ncbi:MAG TPA: TonB-dependent receptor [Vicinamibacterales bacterium]|nr:TonB-dependent receptor [Vicinamibacterales bacterium]